MSIKGFVCYCPDLRLYWYKVGDATKPENEHDDFKFDEDNLETSIATHLANENQAEAEFMATVTGFARLHPHKFVFLDSDKEGLKVQEPVEFWKERGL